MKEESVDLDEEIECVLSVEATNKRKEVATFLNNKKFK